MPTMLFVIPVYNNKDEAETFISKQLLPQTFTDFEICIVVNDTSTRLSFNDNRVKVLYPGLNTGYIGALRWVCETIKPSFEYITLCNTDLDLQEKSFLGTYINELRNNTFSIAGPLIQSSLTQSAQNPIYLTRLTANKLKWLRYVYSFHLVYLAYQTLFYIKKKVTKKANSIHNIHPYALHGSFITLSHLYFDQGGTLNYPIFLYGEEIFFAEESIRIGLPTLLINNITIAHNEHSTTGIFKSEKHVDYLKQSVEYIYNTYYANGRI